MMELLQNSYFAFFLIVTIGYLLGKVSIKGISLDVSAVLFVALFFGHHGILIPKDFQKIGLILFVFTIGMQAGPGFFNSFKKQGRNLAIFAVLLILSASLVTYLCTLLFDIDMNMAVGLLTGALTSTPGLAAAIETTNSPLASIAYGIAYPFGVIGVILFVRILPKILRTDIKQAEKEFESESMADYPNILNRNFLVENENIEGKTLRELRIRHMTNGVVSRIMRKKEAWTPKSDSTLLKGDIIKVIGTNDALKRVELLVGRETKEEIPLAKGYRVQSILVTNKKVVNKTLGEINLFKNYDATVTRIRRSGIDITPSSKTKLQFGDKVMVACHKEDMNQVANIFGNDDKRLSDTNFLPVALGIVMGILVGKVQISFTDSFSFSLGLTGGVLAVGLVISKIGKTGPILWTMSGAANMLLRQIGLLFFLSAVGTSAGANMVSTFNQYGVSLFIIGAIITIVPMVLSTLLARLFLKMNILSLLGALTGSMTSTPGLAAVDPMSDTEAPQVAYATVYPIALVLLIICVQILSVI